MGEQRRPHRARVLRIPLELHEALTSAAERDGRSVHEAILRGVQEWIDREPQRVKAASGPAKASK